MRFLPQSVSAWFAGRGWNAPVTLAYAALVGFFLATVVQFYLPGKGLSFLIAFGSNQEGAQLSKVHALDRYVAKVSDGYDAQYYVQIAMDPSLHNQALRRAVDNLPYRARRIFFPAVAYGFGLGRPAWILQAYALQNAVCWFLLAALALHWFPPSSWENFLRWAGVLLSFGMCASFRNALIDGPSLLLIAGGVFLLERGRPWLSAVAFAFAGLGKETNLLGAAALLPPRGSGARGWGVAVLRGVLAALPLGLWVGYVWQVVGPAADPGHRNFGLPFAGYLHKWQEVAGKWPDLSPDNLGPFWSVLILLALTVQFLFLVGRPQWDRPWWRVGVCYALLMVFLGDAVWEGYPGAATRVLLPMQFAFCVLVPAGRVWRTILILGVLPMVAAPTVFTPPGGEGFVLKGPAALLHTSAGTGVAIEFGQGWYSTERLENNFWAWTTGSANLNVQSPHDSTIEFRLRFGLSSSGPRLVRVVLNGTEVWRTNVSDQTSVSASFAGLALRPGRNILEFLSDEPAVKVGPDPRPLAFSVQNLRFDLLRRLPPAEKSAP